MVVTTLARLSKYLMVMYKIVTVFIYSVSRNSSIWAYDIDVFEPTI